MVVSNLIAFVLQVMSFPLETFLLVRPPYLQDPGVSQYSLVLASGLSLSWFNNESPVKLASAHSLNTR